MSRGPEAPVFASAESDAFEAAMTMPVGRPWPETSATTTVSVRASPERS